MTDFLKLLRNNPELGVDDPYIHHPVIGLAQAVPVGKMSEHDLQVALIQECAKRALANPVWSYLLAIPNGGHRDKATAGKLKAEGVQSGVPDLLLPIMRHGYGALWLELKVSPNKPTQLQSEWMRRLQGEGHFCKVVWDSVDDALALLEWYIGGDK